MTKLYIYCLFDRLDSLLGIYSSLQAVHRDALKICNQGTGKVYMRTPEGYIAPSLKVLRNTFKGVCETQVEYRSDRQMVKILKTKIKE
jgi:hypothetical protein